MRVWDGADSCVRFSLFSFYSLDKKYVSKECLTIYFVTNTHSTLMCQTHPNVTKVHKIIAQTYSPPNPLLFSTTSWKLNFIFWGGKNFSLNAFSEELFQHSLFSGRQVLYFPPLPCKKLKNSWKLKMFYFSSDFILDFMFSSKMFRLRQAMLIEVLVI